MTEAALLVLDAAEARFGFRTTREVVNWSSARYIEHQERVTRQMIEGLRRFDAVLLGAIGHPDAPRGMMERDIIIGLRIGLDLYVNLRPLVLYDERLCPLKGKRAEDIDILVVRENTEDVYVNAGAITGTGKDEVARVEMSFTRPGIERVTRYAFERARARPRKKLTLVDKANAIPVQGLWRTILDEIGAGYPDVERDAMYVDAASMWFVQHPERFDVVLTTNLFGDILTDLGAALVGGLGTGASGNIHPGKVSVFEPIHGSAPKYTGQGVASPVGTMGAVGLMLDHLGERESYTAIEKALREGFRGGYIKGADAGSGRTLDVAKGVAEAVSRGRWA
ncbi:MAG: isocitrate/isopropylmalate dehydrogenase family protein [Chloroflexi bacterium]|nr:isocitrate/isopropylmalate dehydrogenase family protein [Chloroflexota bacterium]